MKQKHWQVSIFDKTSESIRDDVFYTTDTEVYLIFELIDKDFTPDTATVTVYNVNGKATINVNVDVSGGIVRYEIPEEAIGHGGVWRTQVIFTKDDEDYTTGIINFDVSGHLLDNSKPKLVAITNWNRFIKHAEGLIDDWEQLEKIRQANEQQRELAESVRVANEEERKLNEAERISKDSERDSKIDSKADKCYVDNQDAALTAQLAEKVQNFKLKNEVVNGDFSDGVNAWSPNLSTLSVVDGALSIFPSAQNGQAISNYFENVTGNKLYIAFKFKFSSPNIQVSIAGISGSLAPILSTEFDNTWRSHSYIWTCTLTGNYGLRVRDSRSSVWTSSLIDKVNVIDLTKIFGVGNEPTKEEMDELIKVIPNGWWDGELTLTQKQVVTWQLNLIRKNTNAIIALGGTIV